MLHGVLALLLCLSSRCEPGFGFAEYLLPIGWHFSLEIKQVLKRINRRVAGSKGELILYFKSKFWAWVGKLRVNSVHRALFYSLRQLSKLRRALLKLFTLGGNLFKLSLATYSVRFYKWIVRVRIWQVMPTGPNPAKISIPFPWKSPTAELLYYDFHITIKYISKTKYLRPKY